MVSPSGPQFVSDTFKEYLVDNNIILRKVTPNWPLVNAEVECSSRTLEKALCAAYIEKAWCRELYTFLHSYHATSHSVTGVPPVELMFGTTPLLSHKMKSCSKTSNKSKRRKRTLTNNHATPSKIPSIQNHTQLPVVRETVLS